MHLKTDTQANWDEKYLHSGATYFSCKPRKEAISLR